jgi:antitoxin component YwqK of YwqJK toxin-antitoxin module
MRKHVILSWIAIFSFYIGNGQFTGPARASGILLQDDISMEISSNPDNDYDLPRKAELQGWANETMIYNGTVKNHRLQEAWQSWYYNGKQLDSGRLINGIPDGVWKVWDSTGQLLAVRHYDADKLLRIKEEMRLNHPKKSFYPLTLLYKKNPNAARLRLQTSYSFVFTTERKKLSSLKQLVERNINENSAYQPVFEECLHHGIYINYFTGGLVKDSGYYKNGLKEGLWIHRNSPGGYWFTGAYKNGMRLLEWKQFDANGKLILLIFYNRMGQEMGRKKMGQ